MLENNSNTENYDVALVINEENMPIFSNIPSHLPIKVYPLKAETAFILNRYQFNSIYSDATTEFAEAFVDFIISNPMNSKLVIHENIEHWNVNYYVNPNPIIDIVHSKIRRNNKKYVIGIIIGEDEHPSLKPSIDSIKDILTHIIVNCNRDCIVYLFSSGDGNETRANALKSSFMYSGWINNEVITLDDVTSLYQAFKLCDTIIGYDSYRMRVAVSSNKPVIGIFMNSLPTSMENYSNLIKIYTGKKLKCSPCYSDRCMTIENSDETSIGCCNMFSQESINEIVEAFTLRNMFFG
jgi:hypothetical protein